MSTLADIVSRLERLAAMIAALIEDHGERIIKLSKALEIEQQTLDAVELLKEKSGELIGMLEDIREDLAHIQALRGTVETLKPLLGGLEALAATAGEEFAKAGIDSMVAPIMEAVGDSIKVGANIVDRGGRLLAQVPPVKSIDALMADLGGLRVSLEEKIRKELS